MMHESRASITIQRAGQPRHALWSVNYGEWIELPAQWRKFSPCCLQV
jgi:hypothetical protein